ncbi:digestive organ expansion factor [Pluteus cervinus]|uniref:Digestive organ expansion factor n=1 Tax=Pluteus cervinus TaxID=181527 RepID=A0ACD3APD2_9AGAR|nr:digestive organ expansion factor [Pluteus cervinus]
MDEVNATTTRLLTLLNVSATKAKKRKNGEPETFVPSEKLNKRKSVNFSKELEVHSIVPPDEDVPSTSAAEAVEEPMDTTGDVDDEEVPEDEVETEETTNAYERHFGVKPALLTDATKSDVDRRAWRLSKEKLGKVGIGVVSIPESSQHGSSLNLTEPDILEKLHKPFQSRQAKQPQELTQLQNDLLSTLSSRRDLYLTATNWVTNKAIRETLSLHAINHITRKRRRVLKNNQRLASAAKSDPNAQPPEDVQDQGFSRPTILILLPFRNSALDWYRAITSHTPSPTYQLENSSRFTSEYGLPPGAIDKLATAEPGTYPKDHVETFKGNVDDNFRVGIKLTKKSVKMFAEFYQSDIIMASPLGLRRSIEKEKNGDYLSSIEMLIIDQADALTMQNWEHTKFVLSHLNKIPKESHDADFSRIKPWYLDGNANLLRQSILLSPYETSETRALYNTEFKNVAGKIRQEKIWSPIRVPEGIEQNFVHFDCTTPMDEPDKRFAYFTTQLLPAILKSAVQSTNTVIFIPSSFDFIRVQNHFKKSLGVTFTILSEYSSNQEISRAREAFFSGKKSFLLTSERFHFYKRYKIRGIRNVIFYGPPDHPQFFTELLSYPFLDEGVESSDVTCKVLYSKYDWFRLERIVGTEGAVGMVKKQ